MPLKRYYPGTELSDAPEWRDARVEITAFPLSEGSHVPIAHPWMYEQFPDIDGACIVARWRLRHPGRPGVLDVTWDGSRRREERFRRAVVIHGVGALPADAARLWQLWTTTTESTLLPKRARRPRSSHITQAVRATRHFLEGDPPQTPARQDIADFIAAEEGGNSECALDTLKSRWGRDRRRLGEQTITLTEVLEIAQREMHP
jgi:hypothetical protein